VKSTEGRIEKETELPKETRGRLPLYLRQLEELCEGGRTWVTSEQLVEELPGISPYILRKDLSYLGDYGTKGRGYNVPLLLDELKDLLNLQSSRKVALIGVGDVGSTLLEGTNLDPWGVEITLAFDRNPEIIGTKVGDLQVKPSKEIVEAIREQDIKIAIMAVPASGAQEIADKLASAGIKGIVNLAPVLLDLPEEVKVFQMDITSKLVELGCYL